MRSVDWMVLLTSLFFIVVYGIWKSRHNRDMKSYLLANREMHWHNVLFSVMATQASAITFLSTPGQAYVDGMRFVQFYFGLPLAMVVLSITAIPIFYRLNVFTAYEYLEKRFDLKTRVLASVLFLIQRGLAAGLTIFAPSIIFSIILGWNLFWTNLLIGGVVMIYTTLGGNRAVSWTQFHQLLIITLGMATAFILVIHHLPPEISVIDATRLAGKLGRLNAIDFSLDLNNRYTLWSGLIGGFFLQLSYFGTDQSQVQRYLTGKSISHSRLGLLFNGLLKIPMQFSILFLGVMVFIFYQFVAPPVFFNSVETKGIRMSPHSAQFETLEQDYHTIFAQKRAQLLDLDRAVKLRDEESIRLLTAEIETRRSEMSHVREQAISVLRQNNPGMQTSDTNFIFLTFVTRFMPVGLIGLVIAAIVAASMSSTSAELNALASTTVVDIYKRSIKKTASEKHYVWVSKLATLFWGVFAIIFAEYASRLGSLIEAVNILGSLFYGTILGIFLVAFYFKNIRGSATFFAALIAEAVVLACFFFTPISFLWYNVIGCLMVILMAHIIKLRILPKSPL